MSVYGTVPDSYPLEIISWRLDSTHFVSHRNDQLALTAHLSLRICLQASTANCLDRNYHSPAALHLTRHPISICCQRYWNMNQFPIDYAFQPRLRGRLTLGKITFTLETLGFRRRGISPLFSLLMPAFSLPIPPANLTVHLQWLTERSPTNQIRGPDFVASVLCLAPLHYRRMTTRPVSCYALFQGMAASKPTSWLSSPSHFLFHLA